MRAERERETVTWVKVSCRVGIDDWLSQEDLTLAYHQRKISRCEIVHQMERNMKKRFVQADRR